MHIACMQLHNVMSSSIIRHTGYYSSAVSAVYNSYAQIAKKLIYIHQLATISDEPVISLDLWLTIHTLRVERSHSKARQEVRRAAVASK